MSSLDDPFGAGAALHGLASPGHIFSAHRARKDGARVGMNDTAHQEKKNKEEQEKRKRENRRLILEKLCAALPRSFKGQYSKKMKGVPRVTGTLRTTNSYFDPTQTRLETAPPC